jgi:hypothetical protein
MRGAVAWHLVVQSGLVPRGTRVEVFSSIFDVLLVLGTLLGAIHHWFPKMTGKMYDEYLGRVHFALYFVGFNPLYFPLFIAWETPSRCSSRGRRPVGCSTAPRSSPRSTGLPPSVASCSGSRSS